MNKTTIKLFKVATDGETPHKTEIMPDITRYGINVFSLKADDHNSYIKVEQIRRKFDHMHLNNETSPKSKTQSLILVHLDFTDITSTAKYPSFWSSYGLCFHLVYGTHYIEPSNLRDISGITVKGDFCDFMLDLLHHGFERTSLDVMIDFISRIDTNEIHSDWSNLGKVLICYLDLLKMPQYDISLIKNRPTKKNKDRKTLIDFLNLLITRFSLSNKIDAETKLRIKLLYPDLELCY